MSLLDTDERIEESFDRWPIFGGGEDEPPAFDENEDKPPTGEKCKYEVDESEEPPIQFDETEPLARRREDYKILRSFFDGDEPFMNGGFQRQTKIRKYKRKMPDYFGFMFFDRAVQAFLSSTFSRLGEECTLGCDSYEQRKCRCVRCKQFRKAARWAFLIRRYYVDGESLPTCVHELNESNRHGDQPITLKQLSKELEYLRRAVLGQRMDGKPGALKKRGKPPRANQMRNNGGVLNLLRKASPSGEGPGYFLA